MIDKSIWRKALVIALPLMLAESVDSILWLMDTYFVSRLGDNALAAVGVGGYLGWLTFAGGSLFYTGALVLVAQAVGAGDKSAASKSSGEILTSNALLGVPVLAAMWYLAPYLVGFIAGARVGYDVKMLSVEYYRARLLGIPFTYAGLVLGAVYRGVGRTRPVLYATLVFATVNGVLDPILIFGLLGVPSMGVAGAGYASSIANVVYAAILYAMAGRTVGFSVRPRPPGRYALLGARIGFPALVERLAFVGGNVGYIGAVARCGEEALAAHTVGVRVESIAFLPLFSIAEASAALAGQEVGAGRVPQAKRVGWEVAKLNALAGSIVMLVLVALSGYLPRIFTNTPSVVDLARLYLWIAGATEPALGVIMSIGMTIRGAGNTTVPTLINLVGLYLLRVLPAGILPHYMPAGYCVLGAWLAMGIDVTGRGLAMVLVFRRYFERLARRVV
ncbi:MAG: MATE family efflux transporter [Desulfurococcales archaeon]|nr:MATE family efflux transporter [Desulfurococcales archaeon]